MNLKPNISTAHPSHYTLNIIHMSSVMCTLHFYFVNQTDVLNKKYILERKSDYKGMNFIIGSNKNIKDKIDDFLSK